jgi:phosphatidylglycerophosphate synthase
MAEPYQYKVVEKSLTQDFLLKYLWTPIVNRLPASLTPNTITCAGFCCMGISVACVWLALNKTSWAFAGAALFVFLYMTGDNIDGSHARRTGQSSKLGEFLDHWLDSLNSVMVNLCLAFSLHLEGWLLPVLMAAVALAFFATIWEHHHTGVFHSGRLGTNEGLLLIVALYFLLCFAPQAPWLLYQADKITLAMVLIVLSLLTCAVTVLGTLWRVRSHVAGFLPLVLILAATLGHAWRDNLSFPLAALIILLSNTLFAGPLLLDRLAHQASPYRTWVASVLAVVALALLIPQAAAWLFAIMPKACLLYTLALLLMVAMICDLVRAVRYLPGPQKKN